MIFRDDKITPSKGSLGFFADATTVHEHSDIYAEYPVYHPIFIELFKLFDVKCTTNKRRAMRLELWIFHRDIWLKSVKWGVNDTDVSTIKFDSITTSTGKITFMESIINVYVIKLVKGDMYAHLVIANDDHNNYISICKDASQCLEEITIKAWDINLINCNYEYTGEGKYNSRGDK